MSRTALQSYGTQQVMTSSPVKLIALLYDKAIVSLKEAIQAIEDKQIEKRWRANGRAVEIITHLSNTLDRDGGAEIAANLDQLYEFMLARLLEVDMKNDAKPAEEVIRLLKPLRDSWHRLAEEAPGDPAQPRPAPTAQGAAPTANPATSRQGATAAARPSQGQPATGAQAPGPINFSA